MMLNAPRPAAVCVNLDVNAHASFMGWKGLLLGRLQLTIGLPLAAAFTLPQMTGVLAHELGHFSQSAGLRSYFLIVKTREWLLQVAHKRDNWDVWIERHRRAGKWVVIVVANLAWFGLTISRRYLAGLARAAQWMTVEFSRHMEFDADRHEAAIVGAAIFEETTMRLPQLRASAALAWASVNESWAMGRAPEDVPGMIAAVEQVLTGETVARVREHALTHQTGRWDTHPCDRDRIEATRAFGSPSLFHLEGEGGLLFADLQALCREATLHQYEKIDKLDCTSIGFDTVVESVNELTERNAGRTAIGTLFHCSPEFAARWIKFPARNPIIADSAGECAAQVFKEEPAYYSAAETARLHFCARIIREAGAKVKLEAFQLQDGDVESVRSAQAASERELTAKSAALNEMAQAPISLLETSVAQVWDDQATFVVFETGAFFSGEVRNLWRLAGALSELQYEIWRLRMLVSASAVVRLNLKLFPLANGANVLDDLKAEGDELVQRVLSRVANVVMEGSETSPTKAKIERLADSEKDSQKPHLESFLGKVEAIRVFVLMRLAHFALARKSRPKDEEAKAADASDR